MARRIESRVQLAGKLVSYSPLHIGGFGEDVDSDLPLARDGAGQLYVPGTSLAGAMREVAERLFDETIITELWGASGDNGGASFVLVEDAVIENAESVIVEIRDHVGIDREFGVAAEGVKYDRAILPRGTGLKLELTVEVENRKSRNKVLAMLAALKQALECGEIRLGAAKTRGLGLVRLNGGKLTEEDFSTRQAILGWLQQTHGSVVSQADIDAAQHAYPARKRPRLTMKINWKPIGPLMVKAGFEGVATDILPLVSGNGDCVSLVLPGSSVKGAFRSHAERILRTIQQTARKNRGEDEPLGSIERSRSRFPDVMQMELIDELFGRTGDSERRKVREDSACLPGLGSLSVTDCFGEQRIALDKWAGIQSATDDQQLREALDHSCLKAWSQAYHIAVDRWLGSAAEKMLYSVLEPHGTDWEPLTIDVNLERLPHDLHLPGLALLFLVIRDLANDRLPLGYATQRGMGAVQVTGLKVEGYDLDTQFADVCQIGLREGKLTGLPSHLNDAWRAWIERKGEVSV